MHSILERANKRLKIAKEILGDLKLLNLWSKFGEPVVVGAVAYDLVAAPDIDMEIYCDDLKIKHGFKVLELCALNPNVKSEKFGNHLDSPDQGLYWQLRYMHNKEEWKIDMWSVSNDHPGPLGRDLIIPMKDALTDEMRRIILQIKEKIIQDPVLSCPSIYLYKAVFDDNVRTIEQLKEWLKHNSTEELTNWKPKI